MRTHVKRALLLLVQLSTIISEHHLASAFLSSLLLHSSSKFTNLQRQQILETQRDLSGKRIQLHVKHSTATDEWPPSMQRRMHTFQGRQCSYLHMEATSEAGMARPPLLLLHPVGIGISSWFWQRFVASWAAHPHGGSAVIVPDLLGCGESTWSPTSSEGLAMTESKNLAYESAEELARSLLMPGAYVAQCEALLDAIANYSANGIDRSDHKQWAVLVQGGLSPVGILLAATNQHRVSHLGLLSPPSWETLCNEQPFDGAQANFQRLDALPKWAFRALASRPIVKLFSRLFLFASPNEHGTKSDGSGAATTSAPSSSDTKWLDAACLEAQNYETRHAIWRFNAGFCDVPSLERELIKGVPQPTLICVGGQANGGGPEGGKTSQEAAACFEAGMQNARAVVVPEGKRLLPWQNPEAVADSLADFMENT